METNQIREQFIQFPFLLSAKFSRFAGVPHSNIFMFVKGERKLNNKDATNIIIAFEKLKAGL